MIRKSKAKNVVAEDTNSDSISVSYDEEVSRMVNYFKNELYEYFAKRKTIGHITQDLGYSLMAQKKRLDKMGITMTIEKSTDIGSAAMDMEVKRYSSSQYDVAEADEPVKLKRTYRILDKVVYQDDDWRICHYLLAGAKYNNDGFISCPNCGNYAPREELLTGCPYCNTQFKIQDLSLRVAGYSQKQIEQSKSDKLRGKIDIGYALYHESKQKEYDQVLIDVVMHTMVLRFDPSEESATWTKEKITMSFVKHIKNQTKNIFEPSKIQCECCGGSYSLYDGKACTYCGSEIDYPMHAWLLIGLNTAVE